MASKHELIVLAAVIIGSFIFGYKTCESDYETKILEAESVWKQSTLEKERSARQIQDKIVEEYEAQIASYEERIKDYDLKIDTMYVISDVASCPDSDGNRVSDSKPDRKGVSEVPKAKSDLTCYTRAELQRKIAESMAIAEECDKLAIRLNNLIKSCSIEQ